MIMWKATVIGLGTACLLLAAADEPPRRVQVSKTEVMEFPSGGTLRLMNSVGVLTIEAWDRQDVEITTIKSTRDEFDAAGHDKAMHDLENVHITTERRDNQLLITTTFAYSAFPPPYPFDHRIGFYPLYRDVNFDLEYHIQAPRSARITANHTLGQVNVDGLTGDIQVTLRQGEIMLHLPEEERYTIHARGTFGHVDSDFGGTQKRRRWIVGHRLINEDAAATHKLDLRVGNGNIVILKTRVPRGVEPLTPAPRTGGL
jgi:hypothetical protein